MNAYECKTCGHADPVWNKLEADGICSACHIDNPDGTRWLPVSEEPSWMNDFDDIAMGNYDNPDGERWAAQQEAERFNRSEAEMEARWQADMDAAEEAQKGQR